MNKTVFVTQIPNRRDSGSGKMMPAFDVSPAIEHGDIEVCMPPGVSVFNTSEMVKCLRASLCKYDYIRGDSVVASGDPAIIAASGAIIAEHSRNIRLLKWDKNVSRYIPIEIRL